ncbi:MAG: hypothetical protein K2N30_05440, partial [Clostridia bacterium]|nr:hypothetical protein [Clostridia bacterium]
MKMRKTASVLTAGLLLTASLSVGAGCANSGLDEKTFDFGEEYYKSAPSRYTMNYDEMVYDDFTKGVDLNRWVISDSVWGLSRIHI